MKVQLAKGGTYTLNIESFRSEKALKKDQFLKKYKGRLVDVDKVWTNIQDEIKKLKDEEAKAEAEAKAKKEAEAKSKEKAA